MVTRATSGSWVEELRLSGFIDMLGQSEFNIPVDNRAASKLLQGVTTEITGEGGSIAPSLIA